MKKPVLVLVLIVMLTSISSAESMGMLDALTNIEEMINYIDTNYYNDVDRDELIMGAYKGIFETLDKHSSYIDSETYEGIQKQLHGSYVGIGIMIEEVDKGILITNIYGGSSAEQGGLEIGDIILEINGLWVRDIGYERAIDLLFGEPETDVFIQVLKTGTNVVQGYRLIRQVIDLNPVDYEIREDGIGYIRIVEFAETTSEKVDEALVKMHENEVENIIVDLRNNPGGLLTEVLQVLDHFIEKGQPLLKIRSKTSYETVYSEGTGNGFGLVVLVNGKSASASEILAGVLQHYNRALVVGNTSYGKGTVQDLIDLNQGSNGAYKVTIAEFLMPDDRAINEVGISPDVYVENYDDLNLELIVTLAPMTEERDYYVGEIGLNVFGMEQRFELMGYAVNKDGVFDMESQKVLIDYQKNQGLAGEGILNKETINSLNEYFKLAEMSSEHDYQLEKALELFN